MQTTPDPRTKELFTWGIQTEESDYRLHVSFATRTAYLFPTPAGLEAIAAKDRVLRFVHQRDPPFRVTAAGYRIPWREIEGCLELAIPEDILAEVDCRKDDKPDVKGEKAERAANLMLARGLVPFPQQVEEVGDLDAQIRGQDLVATQEKPPVIQVKCDYSGGRFGLFLQTMEANPDKIYSRKGVTTWPKRT